MREEMNQSKSRELQSKRARKILVKELITSYRDGSRPILFDELAQKYSIPAKRFHRMCSKAENDVPFTTVPISLEPSGRNARGGYSPKIGVRPELKDIIPVEEKVENVLAQRNGLTKKANRIRKQEYNIGMITRKILNANTFPEREEEESSIYRMFRLAIRKELQRQNKESLPSHLNEKNRTR